MAKTQHKQWVYQAQAGKTSALHFYGENLVRFVAKRKTNRPLYVYSAQALRERARVFLQQIEQIHSGPVTTHYAMKANSNLHILQLLRRQGVGIDVVSGGELKTAFRAGYRPSDVLFSGVGKTIQEIEFAVGKKIKQINVESVPELRRIGAIATSMRKKANVALRLNPGVNPKTHPYIATGLQENKFGLDARDLPEAIEVLRQFPALQFCGLSLHIGSQLFDFSAVDEAIRLTLAQQRELASLGFKSSKLDIGGGIGVDYSKNSEDVDLRTLSRFCAQVKKSLRGFEGEISCEPGRFLVSRAGTLLGEIQYLKTTPYKKFAILNTGMHHLLRPALYQAQHRLLPLVQRPGRKTSWDVVGPVCESADVIATGLKFSELQQGDWLAIADAGAYGFSMASSYNSFELPEEILL